MSHKDGEKRVLGFSCAAKAIDTDSRTVTHLISDGSIDRDGDMIEPMGWVTENFERNNVVMADHGRSILNIIGSGKVKRSKAGLMAKTTFHDMGIGAAAFGLVEAGIAKSWSVGFRGIEYHAVKSGAKDGCERCAEARQMQLDAAEDDDFAFIRGLHFEKQELVEYSLVAIPANPNAVMAAAKAAELDLELVEKFINGDGAEALPTKAPDGANAGSSSSILAEALQGAIKRARLRTALSKNRRNPDE